MAGVPGFLEFRRLVQESNPCRRREREATYCSSKELRGMDSTLPHFKDSRVRLLDLYWTRVVEGCEFPLALVYLQ